MYGVGVLQIKHNGLLTHPRDDFLKIVEGLKARRVGRDRYQACCPAHDDKSPSLSLRLEGDHVLFYCHASCTQQEVMMALEGRGLWQSKRKSPEEERCPYAAYEIDYYLHFFMVAKAADKRGEPFTPKEIKRFRISKAVCRTYQPHSVLKIIGLS